MHPLRSNSNALRLLGLALLLVASFTLASPAAGQASTTPPAATINAKRVYDACSGEWAGSLEYRDFQSDKRVSLPTTLKSETDGKMLRLRYTYDDGPGKIVHEATTVSVDPERRLIDIQSEGNSSEQLAITEADTSGSKIRLLLYGTGEENGKKVEVSSTLVCGPNTMTWLRETRLPGQEFALRHQYSFTRFPIQAH